MNATERLELRDPATGRALLARLEHAVARAGRRVTVMHVCGSHEQALARYGIRTSLPKDLRVVMGPGCPVCVTDAPEIDAAIDLVAAGVHLVTYGDMLRVPGSSRALEDARASGGRVSVVYAAQQAIELARRAPHEPLVFFATGFETTAVATAALLLAAPPPNLLVLSAHKLVLPAMEIVAAAPDSTIEGFLAAGNAAIITGTAPFEPFVAKHRRPVVVAGFEPLDILAALVRLVELAIEGRPVVENAYPRCVSRSGNAPARAALERVFAPADGEWRGIARIPGGNLVLRPAFAAHDARLRFGLDGTSPAREDEVSGGACRCGTIMAGTADPTDCSLFGTTCLPSTPRGACMVSTEGACRIWHEHGLGLRDPAALVALGTKGARA